ncbi:hypothetical protein ACH4YO_40570 [Streptomyces noursei]|uniref:hypothetical protein n=1 Tax=Streptomyces noursei TaxID=1971 RepID=UPI00081CC05F|nr:hypothetical protein SNOUR_00165 [Streptomyces noursei ATCC 11455]ANZ21979.1 hypothetical protein SNOUR_43785 [Streptomyces noursei ATCC 11455]MCZ0996439.1 hypothetical protein [Streptomyces noursei]
MKYTTKAWLSTTATEIEIKQDTRPTCGGFPGDEARCIMRPDHVVTYTVNRTGIPGLGERRNEFACYQHLHPIVLHAEEMAVAGHASITAYKEG